MARRGSGARQTVPFNGVGTNLKVALRQHTNASSARIEQLHEGDREALAIEVAISIPSARVIRVLEELIEVHGAPGAFRLNNGPELTSEAFLAWRAARGIEVRHIQPGKPDQNAFIERFNRSYREGVLDAYVFATLAEVQAVTAEWIEDYNNERPHDSLGGLPPLTFMPRHQPASESRSGLSA